MKRTRREFLQDTLSTSAAVGLTALLPAGAASAFAQAAGQEKPAPSKLKVLFLGGTGFLGPHTVRVFMERGHEVTLFNRGKSSPHLFPELEKLEGDRYSDMSALAGRRWDVVIDTFAYVPRVVTATADILKDHVKQYVLISSVSVYKDFTADTMDETAPIATADEATVEKIKTHREVGEHYGALKYLCEQAAETAMPGRVTNIRPGLIVGPGDPSDRFTYWPVRVERGGEVLAPGDGKTFVQVIDVRDLGAWIVGCTERGVVGVFNATSPPAALTMGELLDTCKQVAKSDANFTWVPAEFLAEHKVSPWSDMPVWVPPVGDEKRFGEVSVARAVKHGLKFRPLPETTRDTLAWWHEQPAERREKMRAGISAEREKEVLAAWHNREKK